MLDEINYPKIIYIYIYNILLKGPQVCFHPFKKIVKKMKNDYNGRREA
jgi:hypothetical protein